MRRGGKRGWIVFDNVFTRVVEERTCKEDSDMGNAFVRNFIFIVINYDCLWLKGKLLSTF